MHPPYSRDLAASEYHLFRPLQNSLNGKIKLTSEEACENHAVFRSEITQKFHSDDITVLTSKMANDGRTK